MGTPSTSPADNTPVVGTISPSLVDTVKHIEAIPVWSKLNAAAFAQSEAGKAVMASVKASVEKASDSLDIINAAVARQHELVDKVAQQVRSLPKPSMMAYLKKNPDKAKILGMEQYI